MPLSQASFVTIKWWQQIRRKIQISKSVIQKWILFPDLTHSRWDCWATLCAEYPHANPQGCLWHCCPGLSFSGCWSGWGCFDWWLSHCCPSSAGRELLASRVWQRGNSWLQWFGSFFLKDLDFLTMPHRNKKRHTKIYLDCIQDCHQWLSAKHIFKNLPVFNFTQVVRGLRLC